MNRASIFGILAATALTSAAQATTLYSNDFESASTTDLSGSTAILDAPSGSTDFLGPLSTENGTGSVTLTLDTAGYSSLTLTYDVYAIMTLDGDGPAGGNSPTNQDAFITSVTGGPTLEDYSFANYSGDTQDYPVAGSKPQTGATATNTLGYGNSGDATYAFTYTFVPTGNTTAIVFTGQDNQGTGDEYFGLDNIQVTGVPSVVGGVPEPATWAMLLFGFFGLGGLLRAQRRSDRGVRGIQRSAA
ncbi:MAG: PEPxxWA-CTERM sorting domain-containing protein [Caulobacteraceae bacterium]